MADGINPMATLPGKVNADNALVVALDGAADVDTTGTVNAAAYEVGGVAGASGTVTDGVNFTITVVNGIITQITVS